MSGRLTFAIIISSIIILFLGLFLFFQIEYSRITSYTINELNSGEKTDGFIIADTREYDIPVAPRRITLKDLTPADPSENPGQAVPQQETKPPEKLQSDRVAYLTFDDGPSLNTLKVLEILKENGVKATFFVTGNNKTGSNDIYKRIVSEGHNLGNHTYSHEYKKLYTSVDGFMEDFNRLQDFLQENVGVRPEIMRFPGGSNNTVSRHYGGTSVVGKAISRVRSGGYQYFDWNVSSTDGGDNPSDVIINSVLRGAENKKTAIILFHDSESKGTTVEAIQVIIPRLKQMGFRFEVLTKDTDAYQFRK